MKYIQGNLIDLFKQNEFDLIAHQCNSFGVMGSGIAYALLTQFPSINPPVPNITIATKLFGTIETFDTGYGTIVNMYSQFYPGKCEYTGIDSFDARVGALKSCLKQIQKQFPKQKIGLPLIASGIAANLRFKKEMDDLEYFKTFIAPVVMKQLYDMDITIVYL